VRRPRRVRTPSRVVHLSLRGVGRALATLVGRRASAAAGSLLFLVLVPGVVAGVIPWLLTGWDTGTDFAEWLPVRIFGVALIVLGAIILLEAFARFVFEGLGTPAPVAPTEQLVVGGLYRYVRNPMYLAVGAIIVGQGLVLGRPILFLYAAGFALAVAAFVHWYEEPTLLHQFGPQYETYRREVPAWWPRRRPWAP
jgi:protein-S-isoprenylcysteine O-methyltransferase Ste14